MSNTSSDQVKEIAEQTSRIEQQLQEMNTDIKRLVRASIIKNCQNQSCKFNHK